MNRLITLCIIVGLLPTVGLGQYNQGISNVSVAPTTVAPEDIVSVQFDCSAYTPPEPSYPYVYWRIYLDVGTNYNLNGILLASGQEYHDGDPWLQTFTISTNVTIPEDTTPGDYTIKIATCVHPTIWTNVGYFAYDHTPIEVTPPPVLTVGIDIKPGSYPNAINKNGNGVIPVAILGSADFDVTQIDPYSLSFQGLTVRIKGNDKPQCSIADVSGNFAIPEGTPDGYPDLVCQFVDDPSTWTVGDGFATLTGKLLDGTPFEGTDSIKVVQ